MLEKQTSIGAKAEMSSSKFGSTKATREEMLDFNT